MMKMKGEDCSFWGIQEFHTICGRYKENCYI